MLTTSLRKVGGSVMLAVPPAILDLLHLKAGAQVSLAVENGRLVIEPRLRHRYNLEELLAQSDYTEPLSDEDRDWLTGPAVGNEAL